MRGEGVPPPGEDEEPAPPLMIWKGGFLAKMFFTCEDVDDEDVVVDHVVLDAAAICGGSPVPIAGTGTLLPADAGGRLTNDVVGVEVSPSCEVPSCEPDPPIFGSFAEGAEDWWIWLFVGRKRKALRFVVRFFRGGPLVVVAASSSESFVVSSSWASSSSTVGVVSTVESISCFEIEGSKTGAAAGRSMETCSCGIDSSKT